MEDGLKTMLFAFMLFALFGFLILTAVQQQGAIYEKDTSDLLGGGLDINAFNSTLSTMESDAQTLKANFDKQNVFLGLANIILTGLFDIAKVLGVMIITPFTLLAGILVNTLHIPIIVVDVILGILVISIMLAIWQLLKSGS